MMEGRGIWGQLVRVSGLPSVASCCRGVHPELPALSVNRRLWPLDSQPEPLARRGPAWWPWGSSGSCPPGCVATASWEAPGASGSGQASAELPKQWRRAAHGSPCIAGLQWYWDPGTGGRTPQNMVASRAFKYRGRVLIPALINHGVRCALPSCPNLTASSQ